MIPKQSNSELYYSYPQVVLQDIPDELTLALSISGCPLRCKGCHSSFTHNPKFGNILTDQELHQLIQKNKYITAVLFYGGEWNPTRLIQLLQIPKEYNLLTALFSGHEPNQINKQILQHLDILKVGPYIQELGGLTSPQTNQRYIDPKAYLTTGKEILLFTNNTRLGQNYGKSST